jgi:hypothetical protein
MTILLPRTIYTEESHLSKDKSVILRRYLSAVCIIKYYLLVLQQPQYEDNVTNEQDHVLTDDENRLLPKQCQLVNELIVLLILSIDKQFCEVSSLSAPL